MIWDPYLKKGIDLIEKVQRNAARWVFSDYKYTTNVTRLLKRLKLETPGRPKTGPKTNLISQNSERVPECEVEQSRSKQNTSDQIRHYSDNSCLAIVYQTVYHPAPLRYQPTITPQTVMLGGIPPSIRHGHEFLVRNLTLLLINGEWDCDVLM